MAGASEMSDTTKELREKIMEILMVKQVHPLSKVREQDFDGWRRWDSALRHAESETEHIMQLFEAEMRRREAEARLSEANEIFTLLWDEDGSPFQRDDPPTEMLERIAELKATIRKDQPHER